MKVLLKATNQIKDVKDGYALNYLLPKGLAVVATAAVLKKMEQDAAAKEMAIKEKQTEFETLAKNLHGTVIKMCAKANPEGELFGGITRQHIKKALKVRGPLEVKLDKPLKHTGKHPVTVKLGRSKAVVTVEIISS